MTSWGDEVEESVDAVVSKSRVTFDAGFLGQDVVVLSFQVAGDFSEAGCLSAYSNYSSGWKEDVSPSFIIDQVAETRCIDNSQGDARALFVQLQLDGVWLDPYTLLEMGGGRVVGIFAL